MNKRPDDAYPQVSYSEARKNEEALIARLVKIHTDKFGKGK